MLLNLPFYPNTGDGRQCYQVAMQSVLKHFLGKEFSREELDHLTGRKTEFWTWTAQIVPVLESLDDEDVEVQRIVGARMLADALSIVRSLAKS